MKLRPMPVTAIVAAGLLLAMPVHAQPEMSAVSFDGMSFTFDTQLGASVNVTRVPAQPPDADQLVPPDASHIAFTLYGPTEEGARAPRVGFAPGVVRAYLTEDLAGYEEASRQLEALEALLAERPDLESFTTLSAESSGRLPHLPADLSAAQVLRARAAYVDTPQLAGVAYLAAYRQDLYPFQSNDVWFTFQGLSSDGDWYVAADFLLEASIFPERVSPRQVERVVERWARYLEESTQAATDAAPDAFAPPLTSIDALVRSIAFEGTPATEP